ncbi:MAG: hypothetical protein LBI82_03240 [Dysgonamonadaceae bacterium]|jgi:hypothetical protein|nr:hypothetical protein [Dysgonamonadaceae bacterium]
MKKQLLLFAALFLSAMLYAQGNYKSGYIITNQNDTVIGWINFRTDKQNQRQCEFKSDLGSAAKTYLPGDIAGYRFTNEGKYYVSREIQINETPQKVFLEFLVKGIMNLYYYEDEISYYFFENEEGKMEVISQQPERIEETGIRGDGSKVVRKDMRYVGQVRYLFRGYQPIVKKAERINFNQKSMMSIVEEYHNEVCTTGESCIIFQNPRPDDNGLKLKFSAYTGLQLSNYTFAVPYTVYENHNGKRKTVVKHRYYTESNVSPILGAQVNFINPRWSQSWSAQLDVSLSRFIKESSYDAMAYSFRLGVKYTYPKYRISPTVEAGAAFTYLNEDRDILRQKHYGYYLALGADYKIKTSQAIFIRLVYEDYPFADQMQQLDHDKIRLPHIKLGYTF